MSEQNAYQLALKAYASSLHNRAAIEALGLTLLSDNQIDKFKYNLNDCLNEIVKSEVAQNDDNFLADFVEKLNDLAR